MSNTHKKTLAPAIGKAVIPSALKAVGGLRKIDFEEYQPGIYFLCRLGKVVYVGQSKSPRQRISQHISEREKVFDEVFIRHCPIEELNATESMFIHHFEPEYNYTMVNGLKLSPIMSEDVAQIAREILKKFEPGINAVTLQIPVTPTNTEKFPSANPLQVLRLPEVITITGLKKSSIYKRLKEGLFPKPIQIGQRAIGWKLGCIEGWIGNIEAGHKK